MFKQAAVIPILAIVLLLGACSTTGTSTEAQSAASDMPEYRTGSIIAKKKTVNSDNIKAMTPEQLEEMRQNSAIPMR